MSEEIKKLDIEKIKVVKKKTLNNIILKDGKTKVYQQ